MDAIHTYQSKKKSWKGFSTNTLKNVYEEQNMLMLYIKTILSMIIHAHRIYASNCPAALGK